VEPQDEKTTVDGSEIRRAPVEVGSLSHSLQGFSTILGSEPDVFHQQYCPQKTDGCKLNTFRYISGVPGVHLVQK